MTRAKKERVGAVLVLGGGIGGIQTSLDLADSGFKVYLVEEAPSIGGVMAQLDKTFPTNDCALCILAPKLVAMSRHPQIEIIANASLERLEGEAGNFRILVKKKARYVDEEKCTGCGVCTTKCPVTIPDPFNEGLSQTKNIYIPFPQAIPFAAIINRDNCLYFKKGTCRLCEKFCEAKAVDFNQKDEVVNLEVGGIIVALGAEKFKARIKSEYGYKRFPNVITSMEAERILSASGPSKGEICRPRDGRTPKRIAFIQCVGSRDTSCENDYCSAVCCSYATKEAIIVKERHKDIEVTIFYIDLRTYGKGLDRYLEQAKKRYGIRYVRTRVSAIDEIPESGNLKIKSETEDGRIIREEYDLVVLSLGLKPSPEVSKLADLLGIKLNRYGFIQNHIYSPTLSSRPGIFLCGTIQSPKDIPETIAQASSAASQVASLLATERGKVVKKKEYPREIDTLNEVPRIGVIVCHCGTNIAGIVDVSQVRRYAETLENVVYTGESLYACSQDAQREIVSLIKKYDLNRLIVGACSPRTHESLFQETMQEAGLNPYLFLMVNIRDQCSWVHLEEPERATEKSKDLIRMAVAKGKLLEPLRRLSLSINKRGLVIGGGLAGMVAALSLAEQGFGVYLLEREGELGGNLRKLYYTLEGEDVQEYLELLKKRIYSNDLIRVYLNATVEKFSGHVGNFKTTIKIKSPDDYELRTVNYELPETRSEELEHGVIIVATGGEEYKPTEYLYGQDGRVITQKELEERIAKAPKSLKDLKNIVMIQCVGSRDEVRPYCSRICCSQALKNSLKIKNENPGANIYILYRDLRTYGFKEEFYREARAQGIIFGRYSEDEKPEVFRRRGKDDQEILRVLVLDPVLDEKLAIDTDLLVLSAGILPSLGNKELSQILKVPLTEDGFFLEAHVKLRPVDFAHDGIFLCGLAHSPQPLEESISQAQAAATRAAIILLKEQLEAEGVVAQVRENRCSGCKLCEMVCAYKAIEMDKERGIAVINEVLCKGCGACSAICRSGAVELKGFTDEQIVEEVKALVR